MLTPQEVEEFFVILRGMRQQGKTVIIITHKLSEVLAISDEVTVMRDGRIVGRLQTGDTNAAELARLMVGRDVLLRVDKPAARPGETKLDRSPSVGADTGWPRSRRTTSPSRCAPARSSASPASKATARRS